MQRPKVTQLAFSASGRLLGRSTTGAGAGEEISIGTGLSLAAGVLSATGTSTYTDEMAQDAVAAALAAGTHTNVTVTYDDVAGSISLATPAAYTNTQARIATQEWAPNFTAAGELLIRAREAMTIAQVGTSGTATFTYEKSTAAAPGTFAATTAPISLDGAGAILKVKAASVTGTAAVFLERTA